MKYHLLDKCHLCLSLPPPPAAPCKLYMVLSVSGSFLWEACTTVMFWRFRKLREHRLVFTGGEKVVLLYRLFSSNQCWVEDTQIRRAWPNSLRFQKRPLGWESHSYWWNQGMEELNSGLGAGWGAGEGGAGVAGTRLFFQMSEGGVMWDRLPLSSSMFWEQKPGLKF